MKMFQHEFDRDYEECSFTEQFAIDSVRKYRKLQNKSEEHRCDEIDAKVFANEYAFSRAYAMA